MKKWTKEDIEFLRSNSHLSYKELSKQLKRTPDAIRDKFRRYGIKKIKAPATKYQVNEEYFQSWSADMAYILGFIFADGSIRKKQKNTSRVRLSNSDKVILQSIRAKLESDHKIETDKRTLTDFYLDITRLNMVEDLERLGVTENKSKTMLFPEVPDKYFFPFVRGFFDGDGHVRLEGETGRKIRIGFSSGSEAFLLILKEKLEERGIACSKRALNKGTNKESYQISVLKAGREKFYRGLYGTDPANFKGIKMESKYNAFLDYFEKNIKINCEDCDKIIVKKAHNHVLCSDCSKEREKIRKRQKDGFKDKQVECLDCETIFVRQSHNHVRCKTCSQERERIAKRKQR